MNFKQSFMNQFAIACALTKRKPAKICTSVWIDGTFNQSISIFSVNNHHYHPKLLPPSSIASFWYFIRTLKTHHDRAANLSTTEWPNKNFNSNYIKQRRFHRPYFHKHCSREKREIDRDLDPATTTVQYGVRQSAIAGRFIPMRRQRCSGLVYSP